MVAYRLVKEHPNPPMPGMVLIEVEGHRCERCAHEWIPRVYTESPTPRVCPKCKSPYWDKPRRAARGENG